MHSVARGSAARGSASHRSCAGHRAWPASTTSIVVTATAWVAPAWSADRSSRGTAVPAISSAPAAAAWAVSVPHLAPCPVRGVRVAGSGVAVEPAPARSAWPRGVNPRRPASSSMPAARWAPTAARGCANAGCAGRPARARHPGPSAPAPPSAAAVCAPPAMRDPSAARPAWRWAGGAAPRRTVATACASRASASPPPATAPRTAPAATRARTFAAAAAARASPSPPVAFRRNP